MDDAERRRAFADFARQVGENTEQLRKQQEQLRAFLTTERGAYFERWRLHVEPAEASRRAWVRYAVEYGQMAIRTTFALNGGALIAVPAFAELLGEGLWVRGVGPVAYMALTFVIGLVSSAIATACAFFAMNAYVKAAVEERNRHSELVTHDFEVALGRTPDTERSTLERPTDKEEGSRTLGGNLEVASAVAATIALLLFIGGACLGAYVLNGLPDVPNT